MLVYAKMLRDEMKRQTTEAAEAQKELQQMVIYMKNLAETRIEREELDAARAIFSQIQQFAPDDEEIKRLLDNSMGRKQCLWTQNWLIVFWKSCRLWKMLQKR